jgi:hypothetical protein
MFKLCGKNIGLAKNGIFRGTCARIKGHSGKHGNDTCFDCGIKLNNKNMSLARRKTGRKSGNCAECLKLYHRKKYGYSPMNYQIPKERYIFLCGCSGVLPIRGQSNQFAKWNSGFWVCRVSQIIMGSQKNARHRGHTPISKDVNHATIRKLMKDKNCERCGQLMSWNELGWGKTPHLHHNHETGELYGFTHPICNPQALEQEIDRLKKEIKELKTSLKSVLKTD